MPIRTPVAPTGEFVMLREFLARLVVFSELAVFAASGLLGLFATAAHDRHGGKWARHSSSDERAFACSRSAY